MNFVYKMTTVSCFLDYVTRRIVIRGSSEKFVDWRQCAAVMQRDAMTVMPSCNGGGNAVVA